MHNLFKSSNMYRYTCFFICIIWLLLIPITTTVYAQSQSARILIENYDKPKSLNPKEEYLYGAFADENSLGTCYVFFYGGSEKVFGGKGYSLHLQWDTSKPGAYGGYWNKLMHINLQDYNYLTFYIRGFKGGERLKIGLRGQSDAYYESKIHINEALKTGITTEWQKVIIPLNWFKAIETWRDVSIFSINFEYNYGSGKGEILVDEIAFEK